MRKAGIKSALLSQRILAVKATYKGNVDNAKNLSWFKSFLCELGEIYGQKQQEVKLYVLLLV